MCRSIKAMNANKNKKVSKTKTKKHNIESGHNAISSIRILHSETPEDVDSTKHRSIKHRRVKKRRITERRISPRKHLLHIRKLRYSMRKLRAGFRKYQRVKRKKMLRNMARGYTLNNTGKSTQTRYVYTNKEFSVPHRRYKQRLLSLIHVTKKNKKQTGVSDYQSLANLLMDSAPSKSTAQKETSSSKEAKMLNINSVLDLHKAGKKKKKHKFFTMRVRTHKKRRTPNDKTKLRSQRYYSFLRKLNLINKPSDKFVIRDKKKFLHRSAVLNRRYRYARINMFRTLPSFLSMLIRLFYITKNKFDDFIGDNSSVSVDPDLYFDSVMKRFLLF
jgi:hypothetical protein